MEINNQHYENQNLTSLQGLSDLLESANLLQKTDQINQKELRQIELLCQLCSYTQNSSNPNTQLKNLLELVNQTEHFLNEIPNNKKKLPQATQHLSRQNPNQSSSEMIAQINEILSIGISCLEDVMTILKLIRNSGLSISENLLDKFQNSTEAFLLSQAQNTTSLEDFIALFSVVKEFLNELNIELENEQEISQVLTSKHSESTQNKESILDARAMGLNIEDISEQNNEEPDTTNLNLEQKQVPMQTQINQRKIAFQDDNFKQPSSFKPIEYVEKNTEINKDKQPKHQNKKEAPHAKKLKETGIMILQKSQNQFMSSLMSELATHLNNKLNL